jgi:hypothetical protein
MKTLQVLLEVLLILAPRDAVDARRRARAQSPERHGETLDRHVMQQRRQPTIPVLLRRLAHTIQIA